MISRPKKKKTKIDKNSGSKSIQIIFCREILFKC